MKTLIGAVALALAAASLAHAQSYSSEELARRSLERRAVEAVIWGMPAVNYDLMLQEMLKAGGKENEVIYWSPADRLAEPDAHAQPGRDLLMPFFDTKEPARS